MKPVAILIALLFCIIPVNVYAGSFGITPYMVNTQIEKGASTDLKFTIIGYSGLVEISTENMPVTITPMAITVTDSLPIIVTVKCNDDAITGNYDGRIVFLAKSGNSVQSGIKVVCKLTVNGSAIVVEETEQPKNPTMLIIWIGLLLVLLAGIILLSRRLKDV